MPTVPAPALVGARPVDPPASDLGGEHRPEPVAPEPHRLVAHLDAPLVLKVLDVPQRRREPYKYHHCQANDLGGWSGETGKGCAWSP